MDNTFPSRKQIVEDRYAQVASRYQDNLVSQIKEVDVSKIDFTQGDFKPRIKVAEKQKVHIWIRLYLKEEDATTNPGDTVKIKYNESEELETTFICYSKKGIEHDSNEIVNYDTEDDKKVMCLMVDLDKINYNSEGIPFIRSMFKSGRYYEFQLVKRGDFQFINTRDSKSYEYYDVDF